MKKLFLFSCVLFCAGIATNGQTLYVPGGTVGISANNNVGIGTSSPDELFHIYKTVSAGAVWGKIQNYVYTGGTGSTVGLKLSFFAPDPPREARIYAFCNNEYGLPNRLTFALNNGNDNIVDRMTILDNGNTGIGTISPGDLLTVSKTNAGAVGGSIRIENIGYTAGETELKFVHYLSPFRHAKIHAVSEGYGNIGSLRFGLSNNADVYTDYLTILQNGNVGIGTPTPGYFMTVKGAYSAPQALFGYDGSNGIFFHAQGTSYHFNWLIGQQRTADGAIEFTPSTTAGGTTFSTPAMVIRSNGNVGIGITNPGNYKLNVAGKIRADEVVVNTTGADFVFEPDYKLLNLTQVEKFIKENNHLPNLRSSKEMMENGMNMSEMQTKLLQKIEELTLYVIELNRKNDSQIREIEALKHELTIMKDLIIETNNL